MKLGDLTELAARNLREAVLRNSLTTLGISVGVASLVALLSLGVGLQQLVDRSVARAGLFDTVSVRSRQSAPFGQPGGGRRNPRDAAELAPPRPLDDAARKEIAALPNVLEVNPEVRFTAEARREPISQLVMVSGMAPSSQSSGTLDGLNGHFFSSPDAEEAIVQGDLAKRLVDVGKSPASLLGQEITLRFAQRQALPPPSEQASTDAPNQAVGPDEEAMGFSIVPSEKKFLVVGVTPTSDSGGGQVGFNNAGMYLPLAVAEKLQVVQQGDLRDMSRATPGAGHALRRTEYSRQQPDRRGRNRVQRHAHGLRGIFVDRRHAQPAHFFCDLRYVPGNFRKPGAGGRVAGNYQHAGDGHPRTPPRNWSIESVGRGGPRCAAIVFCRGRRDGIGGRLVWRAAGLGDWPRDSVRDHDLSEDGKA